MTTKFTLKRKKILATIFTNYSIRDLRKQYQFCQEKPDLFNNQILKLVIKEIKNRRTNN